MTCECPFGINKVNQLVWICLAVFNVAQGCLNHAPQGPLSCRVQLQSKKKKKLEPANQSLQNNSKLPRKCAGLTKLCKTLGHLQEQDWIPLTLGFGWLVSLTVVRRRKELKRSSHVVAALRKASCLRISCSTSSTLPPSSLLLSKGS